MILRARDTHASPRKYVRLGRRESPYAECREGPDDVVRIQRHRSNTVIVLGVTGPLQRSEKKFNGSGNSALVDDHPREEVVGWAGYLIGDAQGHTAQGASPGQLNAFYLVAREGKGGRADFF